MGKTEYGRLRERKKGKQQRQEKSQPAFQGKWPLRAHSQSTSYFQSSICDFLYFTLNIRNRQHVYNEKQECKGILGSHTQKWKVLLRHTLGSLHFGRLQNKCYSTMELQPQPLAHFSFFLNLETFGLKHSMQHPKLFLTSLSSRVACIPSKPVFLCMIWMEEKKRADLQEAVLLLCTLDLTWGGG